MEAPQIIMCPACKARNAPLIDSFYTGNIGPGFIIDKIVHCIDCLGGDEGQLKMIAYLEECFRTGNQPQLNFKL